MSLLKSEAKLSAVNELGNRLDDALDGATKELHKEEGAVTALKNASGSLDNLLKVISKELDDKLVDLETQVLVKKYFDRARSIVNSMAAAAENARQAQVGKIAAFQHSVTIAKKYKDEEMKKLSAMKSAIERSLEPQSEVSASESNQGPRPVGVRPPPPIKMQRLVADAVAEAAPVAAATEASTGAEEVRATEQVEASAEESHTEEAEVAVKKSKKQKK
jgi:hypothetical protein